VSLATECRVGAGRAPAAKSGGGGGWEVRAVGGLRSAAGRVSPADPVAEEAAGKWMGGWVLMAVAELGRGGGVCVHKEEGEEWS
jgi:hypothetical protein